METRVVNCRNGGRCRVEEVRSWWDFELFFYCVCRHGYEGDFCEVQIGTYTLCNLHVEMKMAHLLLMLDSRKQVRNSNYIKEVTASRFKKKEKTSSSVVL